MKGTKKEDGSLLLLQLLSDEYEDFSVNSIKLVERFGKHRTEKMCYLFTLRGKSELSEL